MPRVKIDANFSYICDDSLLLIKSIASKAWLSRCLIYSAIEFRVNGIDNTWWLIFSFRTTFHFHRSPTGTQRQRDYCFPSLLPLVIPLSCSVPRTRAAHALCRSFNKLAELSNRSRVAQCTFAFKVKAFKFYFLFLEHCKRRNEHRRNKNIQFICGIFSWLSNKSC